MSRRIPARRITTVVAGALASSALLAAPALADKSQTVKCVGDGDFCGATVSLAGGASNRVVTIRLTDTDLKRVGTRVFPGSSRGAFEISKGSFREGGSVYRFTLNAVQSNPKNARIVLLFAGGSPAR